MKIQELIYAVKVADKLIALFLKEDDAIKFAKTKHENYSWVEVWDIRNDRIVYEWTY